MMKQTEIGLIPDDWEVKRLNAICNNISSGKNQNRFVNGIYPVYGSTGIIGFCNNNKYSGDAILVARVGANAGLVNKVAGKYDVSDNTLVIQSDKCDIDYLSRLLAFRNLNQLIFGSGQPLITGGQLKALLIQLPSLAEQQRIAKALSDVDALISTTEKLIQKKKNIKQGAMQNLLTGKKRLPGFAKFTECKQTELGLIPEDWEVIQIKDNYFLKGRIGWQGLKASEFLDRGPYLVTGTDFENGKVNWDTCYHISEKRYAEDKALHVKEDDLLITKDGTVGKVAYIDQKPEKVSLNSHLLIIRSLKDNLINKYLYYILNSKYFFDYYQQTQTGTTMASLSQDKISKFMYPLPSKKEQIAIANVLSSIDQEIETLNTKLEKYRNLKTAMMQQLLTGKIRLG